MRDPRGWHHCRKVARDVRKRREPEREQYAIGSHDRAVVERCRETTVCVVESRHLPGPRFDAFHLFEPLRVLEIETERERLGF